jgi:hypothetical protein
MDIDELTDFRDWTEIQVSLTPWTAASDDARSFLLMRGTYSLAVWERPRAWRARHRRELHRRGFRPRNSRNGVMWEWTVPEEHLRAEMSQQPWFSDAASPALPVMQRLGRSIAHSRLLGERAVVVMRDVFRLAPADVLVLVPVEDEWAYDNEWPDAL